MLKKIFYFNDGVRMFILGPILNLRSLSQRVNDHTISMCCLRKYTYNSPSLFSLYHFLTISM